MQNDWSYPSLPCHHGSLLVRRQATGVTMIPASGGLLHTEDECAGQPRAIAIVKGGRCIFIKNRCMDYLTTAGPIYTGAWKVSGILWPVIQGTCP